MTKKEDDIFWEPSPMGKNVPLLNNDALVDNVLAKLKDDNF